MHKRILIFSLAYYPHVGGAEVAVKEITDRTPDIEFHMVTLRFSKEEAREEKIGSVMVHRIGLFGPSRFGKFVFQLAAARKAVALHRQQPFDATWAMMAHSAGVPAALFNLYYPKVPYVLTLQEGDPPKYIERLMRPLWPLFARAFTRATVVQVISTFLGKWARWRGFRGPLEVIPNGVETKQFLGEGVAHDGVVLITTSRLVHKNAIDVVLRALPLLPHVEFNILGVGPEEKNLRALARELGVEDRVHFVGFVAHAQLPAYLHRADIFIRPSRSEGMGNSFVEAFAAGIPVIATQEGGISDLLFDAKKNPDKEPTGYAVAVESSEDIARAVNDIVENPHQVLQVVAHARRFATSHFDWDTIAKDMQEKVFARVLRNR